MTAQLLCHVQNFITITSLRFVWAESNFHRIWITMVKSFVTWAPRSETFTACPELIRADSRFAPSQCETLLQSNAVSHWLGANLESALTDCSTSQELYTQFAPCCLSLWLGAHQVSFTISSHTWHRKSPQAVNSGELYTMFQVYPQAEHRTTSRWMFLKPRSR